jgi:hypothetical protein
LRCITHFWISTSSQDTTVRPLEAVAGKDHRASSRLSQGPPPHALEAARGTPSHVLQAVAGALLPSRPPGERRSAPSRLSRGCRHRIWRGGDAAGRPRGRPLTGGRRRMPSLATNPRSVSQRRGRQDCEREEKWIETKRS